MADKKFLCVIDTETTGLDPEVNELLEIAFVRLSFEPGPDWKDTLHEETRVVYKTFPKNPNVDPIVAAINGYNPDVWRKEAISLEHALQEALPLLRDALPVGSKPSFDLDFLKTAVKSLGWQMPRMSGHHPIDVMSAFAKLFLDGTIKKLGQSHVMSVLLPSETQRHTAETDVDHLIELLKLL